MTDVNLSDTRLVDSQYTGVNLCFLLLFYGVKMATFLCINLVMHMGFAKSEDTR